MYVIDAHLYGWMRSHSISSFFDFVLKALTMSGENRGRVGDPWSIEMYLAHLKMKRAQELLSRSVAGKTCSPQDAYLCLKAVESYARGNNHTELLEGVSKSMNVMQHIMWKDWK